MPIAITKNTNTILAAGILFVMAILLIGSVWDDSATFDEVAHIPSGFGYVTQLDARLNPEHPPLIKALSASFAWLASRPYFPTNVPSWRDAVNGQWDQGRVFLYESGNDADRLIFWARIPIILLTLAFGWIFFRWTRTRFGNTPAFLALLFFAFSPTILAHGRYVTTDIGAAFGFFICIAAFLKFLEMPSWRNTAIAGIIFGTVQLIKFSLVLVIPVLLFMLLLRAWSSPRRRALDRIRLAARLLAKSLAIGALGLVIVWGVYAVFMMNYPKERQFNDAKTILSSYPWRAPVDFDLMLIRTRITRPLGQYLFGFLMTQQRSLSGNTSFFLGEISSKGSRLYFPLMYIVKEPLALHLLTLLSLFGMCSYCARNRLKISFEQLRRFIRTYFTEFSALVFILFYWAFSVASPLNIGVRHVLPAFPFIYLLVARLLGQWMQGERIVNPANWSETIKTVLHRGRTLRRIGLVTILMCSIAASALFSFPHFLSYYNILGGGTRRGFRIAVDSNYDWGQDLKRLTDFVRTHDIEKISLDYFGGGSPRYELGEKFEPWWSSRGPAHGWFAVSATLRQGAFARPAAGFVKQQENSYEWLTPFQPIARAGQSIFIYYLP